MNLLESAGFSKSNPYYIVPQGKVFFFFFFFFFFFEVVNKKNAFIIFI